MRSPLLEYVVAIAACAGAIVLRWLLDPVLDDSLPLVTLFGAVAIAVWVGGWRPAVVVTLLGYFACNYLFIEPRTRITLGDAQSMVGLIAYLFTCALIVGIGEAARVARSRVNERGELLRVTLASIGDAVITTGTDGHITYLNAVAETLTGWRHHEALGQPLDKVFRILNENTRQPLENPATRALRDNAVVALANHALLIGKDGVERPIDDSAAPISDDRGRVSGCVLIFRDVSLRRLTERDAADRLLNARLLASIVESSDDAIVSKSLDGIIRSWNAGAERVFGYTADQAIGRHISLIIPPDRIGEEDEIIARLKSGQRVDHFETERRRSNGERIQVSLTISPLFDQSGKVIGASKIARDITHQRRTEAERDKLEANLRQLAADLATADRRKDEFLATLSHELRNPLATLHNSIEILKRAGDRPELVAQATDTMARHLAQLVRLVDDLLDLSRIAHNRIELQRSEVDLVAVIHEAVEGSRPVADRAGLRLQLDLPPEPVWLNADRVRLAQIFGNLLNNSCKYTPPPGTITVRAQRHEKDVVVRVEDTGVGIPPGKLDSIFDMFMQLEESSQRSQGGLGIGLTLVKRLVEMHGGTIEARSEGENRGSQFVVRLPILAESHEPAAPVAAPAEKPRRYRVLIVDDNQDAASSLAVLLQTMGHDASTAHDGLAALEAVESRRPEVVLLDIGLPKLHGYEVCRRVRAQRWGRDMMLVALTGWGQEDDRRKSREAGFDGHLVKPVDYAALIELLDALAVERPKHPS